MMIGSLLHYGPLVKVERIWKFNKSTILNFCQLMIIFICIYVKMIEEIAFIYWPAQFVEYTLDFALENVARQNKIKYTSIKYNPSERHLNTPASLAKTLICYCFDSNRNDSDYEQARLLMPNALFLQFGGDLHYDPGIDQHTRNVDIHVDTMFEVV